jgi:hypothetical protein
MRCEFGFYSKEMEEKRPDALEMAKEEEKEDEAQGQEKGRRAVKQRALILFFHFSLARAKA